jgi:two-component system phosphate regulon sensor histidine kinase PhoR
LFLKTERLLSRSPEQLSSEDVTTDSYGEWSEIESNLEDIRKDLEAKARRLDTERVELATIMSSISDAVLAVDQEGIPLFFNSRFEVLFGGAQISDKNLKLWEMFRDPSILDVFRKALTEGKPDSTGPIPVGTSGGRKAYFSLSVAPLRRDEKQIYGAVGIFHDVSELKSAEQMRIDFVANVSHELRTPLTSIKGYAETLVADLDSKKTIEREFLTIITRNANRLMSLMEDLLDLSSIESDVVLQKELVSTEEITQKVFNNLKSALSSKNQKAVGNYLETHVIADPGRLEQVLVNLLDNASKYTPSGGEISVSWTREEQDVVLRVSDSGPGIPLEHQARLFERFYRIDKARSREQGGTGLGLAIVKHIMQRHQGSASVESQLGKGATFICRFPAAILET